jgi:SAM-dependent methyltransferase
MALRESLMQTTTLKSSPYNEHFFDDIRSGSRRSAMEIVPLVLNLLPCKSVVDVGCGVATWLRVFRDLGVPNVTGFDGDYVERVSLEIDAQDFHAIDLSAPPTWPQTYDLAVSLEVAEHLPAASADHFVSFLCSLAPVVLFSAAIPGQGGTEHLNEQWPEYWMARFQSQGYTTIDFLRSAVWNNENVERWYAQNLLLFVRKDFLATRPMLEQLAARTNINQLSIIHPRTLENAQCQIQLLREEVRRLTPGYLGLREILRLVPGALHKGLKRRFGF